MANILAILAALPALVQTIIELMKIAEDAYGAGKGSEKKQTVLDAIQAMIGDATLWGQIKALFSGVVNMIALFHFGSSGKEPVK